MELTTISVSKMHGMINASVKLKKNIAIIVGVNGSGKTSLLNLTANVLRMNLSEIFQTTFEKFSLKGRVKSASFEVTLQMVGRQLEMKFKHKNKLIETKLIVVPERDESIYQDRTARFAYDRLMRKAYDDLSASASAKFLSEYAKVTLVRLDRTLYAEESDGSIAIDTPIVSRRVREQSDDPISKVETVTTSIYNKYRVEARRSHEELTGQIVLLLFQIPSDILSPKKAKFTADQLEALQGKLMKVLSLGSKQELAEKVRSYFTFAMKTLDEEAKDSSPEANRKEMVRFLFRSLEYPRLKGLSAAFEKYERELARCFEKLEKFQVQLNQFLGDSSKEVFFSESESALRFRLIDSRDPIGREISELSSGEKQIVIMLTYLAFFAGEESIFIVDEPELSLHLAWQRKLVNALEALRPNSSQLILATHSPEIVGKHRVAISRLSPIYAESDTA